MPTPKCGSPQMVAISPLVKCASPSISLKCPFRVRDAMQSTYETCLALLLAHEGGYTNHPSDPGGPTNFGITIYDYRKYVKPNAAAADVRAMKLDEAKAIYRA